MPVVIAPDAFDFWLDCTRVDALTAAALIAPAPENLFEAYEISSAVNHTANDSPAVIAPLGSVPEPPPPPRAGKRKKDDGQASLF
jgi:putative SOS response-associated peptidase YedK